MAYTDAQTQQLRDELHEKLRFVRFPLDGWGNLLVGLPQEQETPVWMPGGWHIPAKQVGERVANYISFPYDDLDTLVDDIITALEATS